MVYLSTCPKDIFPFGFGVPSSYQKKEQVHNIEITFLLDEMPKVVQNMWPLLFKSQSQGYQPLKSTNIES